MASNICMNSSCRATSSIEWRKGWGLRSGGFANLCDKCWSTYEQLVFCDTFHLKESGWRECISCGRRLHCGCIASKSFLELLDNGGVECISCVKNSDLSSVRVARQPVDGRGRNQLLPRYWPRITDQELQQISGASNSTIVPLFEKVLSASDAGRIGRLVLPKACAEAYFPHISQPEGLPLKIQDAKGNEWLFQFRFWPNNNSRMYVLEGVAPCIQSMQLQAGDTVTFSRIDPERKLVIGFRKAFNTMTMQSPRGSTNMHLSALSKPLSTADGDVSLRQTEKQTTKTGDWPNSFPMQPLLVPEKKRSRNIGSKSKRLVIDSEDALELKLTWEEAQDLLCPPPTVKPSIVMIEGYEFEEYDEPPVFGKKTIFTSRTSGEQDQWAQCDSCSRWRRLPADVLLPPKWSCADNDWDPKRCSCSAPDEISPTELDNLLRLSRDFKKRKIAATQKTAQECEPSALEALATAAVLGDDRDESGTPSVLTTTKHPRHRSGCTCIVCIQPPSGKGPKHKPTCTCNVCTTVKRRFETLMTRKKKRQSAHEAEIPPRKFHTWGDPKDEEADVESASNCTPLELSENEVKQATKSESNRKIRAATNKGQIDLNCHPCYEDDMQADSAQVSMTSLVQEASLPLEMYLKHNGLTSLSICEQQAYLSPHAEGQRPDKGKLTSVAEEEEEEGGDKVHCESD